MSGGGPRVGSPLPMQTGTPFWDTPVVQGQHKQPYVLQEPSAPELHNPKLLPENFFPGVRTRGEIRRNLPLPSPCSFLADIQEAILE